MDNPSLKKLTKQLTTPAKIQDFINGLAFNFEKKGDTLKSPTSTVQTGSAHCFEGALLGAWLLSQTSSSTNPHKPMIVHLHATKPDYDHVIAPFIIDGKWGALSKTNHAVLRYREPVYATLHELVMSYFHEYFLDNGKKTLRSYSDPLDLSQFEKDWVTADEFLWGIDEALDQLPHHDIVPAKLARSLRPADPIECTAGMITEWKK